MPPAFGAVTTRLVRSHPMIATAGVLVLLLLYLDVFLTIFHPEGHGGPLTGRLNRAAWGGLRALAGARPAKALAFAGPLMPVLTLIVWMGLLIAGYAAVYYPAISSFLVSPGTLRGRVLEAVYFSGYTASTLGLGDLVPDAPALRLVAVLEALSGFALATVAITYLLAIYRELLAMQTLAAIIAGYFRRGERETLELVRSSGFEPLARWSDDVTARLLQVQRAHFQYPIVHYFRPTDQKFALPVQLAHLLAIRRWAGGVVGVPGVEELSRHPSVQALVSALERYLREVESHFVPAAFEPGEVADADETERALRRLLRYMRYGSDA